MKQVPIIDIQSLSNPCTQQAKQQCVDAIYEGFSDIGFIAVFNHGIESSLLTQLREQVILLFNGCEKELLKLQVCKNNYRGYIPLGFFTPNAGKQAVDNYQAFKLHQPIEKNNKLIQECDLYGHNVWPSHLPNLRPLVHEYWQQCLALGNKLLGAISEKIDCFPDDWQELFVDSLSNMTLMHYPPSLGLDTNGIHPHKDTDVLTILAPDTVGGLQLRVRDNPQWVNVAVPPEALLINVGDMLETWTNGTLVSTPHRVVRDAAQDRYSFPFFMVPRHDAIITQWQGQQTVCESAGSISRKIWYSNWPDAAAIESHLDPYIN